MVEKKKVASNIWIMPRQEWMLEIVNDIMNNIGEIFKYAKSHFRTEENYKKIEEITIVVKNDFKKFDI